MVKKRKKKNAITLLALVITIVIMLLLAGVAIQMTMGENGLIAKSVQAQKEQAKAELYDTAKLSYMSLNAKALENGQPSPEVELALSTTEFTNKYNVVGDDITDKKGTIIDTKANVLNIIQGTVAGGFSSGTTSGTTTPAVYKTVGGVPILEDDKDKMILKLKILREKDIIDFRMPSGLGQAGDTSTAVNIDYGNGIKREVTDLYNGAEMEYDPGEYIVKIERIKQISIQGNPTIRENYEIEILQWGKLQLDTVNRYEGIKINNVSKIYEPEPDKIVVEYKNPLFKEIPEWLFSKKVTNEVMSKFVDAQYLNGSSKIEKIPEDLFKNCVNVKDFSGIFEGCEKIKEIPENLFKNNVNVTNFMHTFYGCTGLTSIPEGLFKNNVNVKEFREVFKGCTGVTSIPEGLFKNNVNVKEFHETFYGCTGLTSISEELFMNCVNVTNFKLAFYGCTGLTSIPEGLFKNNVNVIDFSGTFMRCTGLTSIPETIVEFAKKVKERGGNTSAMFWDCTSASNYSSIPDYIK